MLYLHVPRLAPMTKPLLALCAVAVLAAGCGSTPHQAATNTQRVAQTTLVRRVIPVTVSERALGSLATPVQDATSATWHRGAILAGGLTAADTSTSNVVLVRAAGSASRLPLALHDATAANLGG